MIAREKKNNERDFRSFTHPCKQKKRRNRKEKIQLRNPNKRTEN